MLLYFLLILVSLLTWYLRKNSHFFNTNVLRDFSDCDVPLIKNGFNIARMNEVSLFQNPRRIAKKFGKSYRAMLFNHLRYMVIKAKDAEKILTSSKHLEKSDSYGLLKPFLKTGLLISHGEKWFARRRILTPAFHFNILKEYFEIFKEESDKLVETLTKSDGKVIDVVPVATSFTLNTVCESAMGVKLSNLGNDGVTYRNNIYLIAKSFIYRFPKPWLHINFIFDLLGYLKELNDYLKPVHDFTKAIIKKRRIEFFDRIEQDKKSEPSNFDNEDENIYMRSKKKRYAMMDTLLQAQSEGLIDDEGIIEETDTFTFEGHDTTSAGMTFTLLLLAHHPEVQEKLFEEIQEFASNDEELSIETFNKMPYMERVLKESMRVYPPVPFIARKFAEDYTSDGVTYPKGTDAFIFIYDIHHDPEVFPDPEKFDPDRFLSENCENRSNFAFIAFSAGMRNCIGQKFATLELKVMLTKVIQNFKVMPITRREDLVFIADLVLRTNHPVKMQFVPRKLK